MSQESQSTVRAPMGLGTLFSILVLVFVLAWTGFSVYQKHSLNRDIATLMSETADAQAQLDQMKAEALDSLIVAQETVAEVAETGIVWSDVMAHLGEITPLDIFYRSYSASSDGTMTVSVLSDSYDSAAGLLSIFEEDESFGDAFASSLTQGSTDSGSSVVSFGLTFNVD